MDGLRTRWERREKSRWSLTFAWRPLPLDRECSRFAWLRFVERRLAVVFYDGRCGWVVREIGDAEPTEEAARNRWLTERTGWAETGGPLPGQPFGRFLLDGVAWAARRLNGG